jgi:glycosyltransferase involved in cell wall biosynthesis
MKTSHIPLISIGLPVYNGENYVKRAIDSVLKQSFCDFELVISDDFSNDSSCFIIERQFESDPRIKFYKQPVNIGFRNNYNFVLNSSCGKYFAWIGQDDYWDKTYLQKLYDLMESDLGAVLAACGYQDVKKERFYRFPLHQYDNQETRFESLRKFIKNGDLSFYYGLHKADNLKKIGGYQNSSRPFFKSSDYLTIFRVLLEGKMLYLPEYLFYKEDTGNYMNRYEYLKRLKINRGYLNKAFRYLFFPILFVYDFVVSARYVVLSDFDIQDRLKLGWEIFIYFFRRLMLYFISIFIGLFLLARSFINHLF